jgi:phosphoglycerol transferase MdoB-like AlkP superfamily enzyme
VKGLPLSEPPTGPPAELPGITPRHRALLVAAALVFTLVWAFACNLLLDTVQSSAEGSRELDRVLGPGSAVFYISSAVIWIVLIGLVALTGRVLVSAALLMATAAALAFANYEKLSLRREPLYPSDLAFVSQPGFLREMIDGRTLALVVVGILVFVVAVVVASRLLRRFLPPISRRAEPRLWRGWVAARVAVLVVVAAFVVHAAHFNADDNKLREAYLGAGVEWVEWSQRANYLRHGFVSGVLYNTATPAMKEPEGYSEAAMDELVDRWTEVAEATNEGRDPAVLDDVNIVVILSESFSDPTVLEEVTLERDPIPYTHRLMERTPSGEMLTQFIGGGTANMEFETLTGFSLSQFTPQMNTPYQQLVPNYSSFPSAVESFEARGHVPVAIHPYRAIMYERDRVYPVLGFDEFVDETAMQSLETLERSAFASDESSYAEVEHHIEANDAPVFVNLVTMQNHYPMAGKYADPISVGPSVGVVRQQLSAFAKGLEYSDEALRDFLTDLEGSSEKTAVVFYGDHAPPFWPRSKVFEQNEEQLRKTPFFLWSNFSDLEPQEMPLTSPIQFLPLLFEELEAPVSPWYALLDALHDEVPAMALGEYHTAAGEMLTDPEQLDDAAQQLLEDYRMVQYDLTIGERWSEDELLSPATP